MNQAELNKRIAEEAQKRVGIPYCHQGRTSAGLDCVGLIVDVLATIGVGNMDADRRDYLPTGTGIEVESRLAKGGFRRIPKGTAPKSGHLIGFIMGSVHRIQHVGVMIEGGRFVHTHQGVGKIVEHNFSGAWLNRVGAVWEFPAGDE